MQLNAVRLASGWTRALALCTATLFSATFAPKAAADSWTPVTNLPPTPYLDTMLLLTDGTVMILSANDNDTWFRLTPDIHGSYINGTWSTLAKMGIPRLYFGSQVMQNGNVFIVGGEYTGPYYDENITGSAEIYNSVTNSFSPATHYPDQAGCGSRTVSSDVMLTTGSNVVTGIYSTDRMQVGWTMTKAGSVPAGTTITSVDSATQVHISNNALVTGTVTDVPFKGTVAFCFGDDPTILVPNGNILAGNIFNNSTMYYNIANNSWSLAADKVYNDRSDEEGWTKMSDGTVLNYDLFEAIAQKTGYAEEFNPATSMWTSVSPADGTASGTLPVLSSSALGDELGPILRLQDGRAIVIGANQFTALYTPSTNTWAAGPQMLATLTGPGGSLQNQPFGADDAPAALLPNGHVIIAADAGVNRPSLTGNTTMGSAVVTNILTAGLQAGWAVAEADGKHTDIPSGTTILSVDSASQLTLSKNALTTTAGEGMVFGGTFDPPTVVFDFDPVAETMTPINVPDANLPTSPSYVLRMLVLPTGQLLFNDSTNQLLVYTPDGTPSVSVRPVVNAVAYNGGGIFTLTGKQLNGPSNGAAYGDDVQMDENYPIVRLQTPSGNVYYCRSTNWSSTGVGAGATPETVNFTLNSALTPGNYLLTVVGAGVTSLPVLLTVTQAEVNGQ